MIRLCLCECDAAADDDDDDDDDDDAADDDDGDDDIDSHSSRLRPREDSNGSASADRSLEPSAALPSSRLPLKMSLCCATGMPLVLSMARCRSNRVAVAGKERVVTLPRKVTERCIFFKFGHFPSPSLCLTNQVTTLSRGQQST